MRKESESVRLPRPLSVARLSAFESVITWLVMYEAVSLNPSAIAMSMTTMRLAPATMLLSLCLPMSLSSVVWFVDPTKLVGKLIDVNVVMGIKETDDLPSGSRLCVVSIEHRMSSWL